MEITCQRCHTEYEFDDALVSERGTTVKCTSCGEQFKVYRPNAHAGMPERWIVRQSTGHTTEFTSLRDLQRAIVSRQVGRNDLLSRGDAPPRPLGSIPELEPFFAARLAAPGGLPPSARRAGAAPAPTPAAPGVAPFGTTLPSAEPSPFAPAPDPTAPGGVPVRTGRTDPPPPPTFAATAAANADAAAAAGALYPGAAAGAAPTPPVDGIPAGARVGGPIIYEGGRPMVPTAPVVPAPQRDERLIGSSTLASGQAPAPASPVVNYATPNPYESSHEPPATQSLRRYGDDDWFDEPRFGADRHRSRALRWLVALLLLGIVGFFAAATRNKYLPVLKTVVARWSGSGASGDADTQARVAAFLQEGERALADGDLDAAKEALDKASAFAEKDPKVLTALAHLAAVRADILWLKVRLLPPDQPDVANATKALLRDAASRATKAADAAVEAAPGDPLAARTKIDALRIADDRGAARLLVGRVSAIASDPETAYVLAALDLAEEHPSFATVLDRLRAAASAEHSPQRASSALVYALARSGDIGGARQALDRIAGARRPPVLLPELKAFMAHQQAPLVVAELDGGRRWATANDAGLAGRPGQPGTVPAGTGAAASGATERGHARGSEGEPGVPGDYRAQLREASKATASGQYDRAEQLYRTVLDSNPGDTEALSGLGDIARARGRIDLARSYYEQVIAANPHYLPAMSALADIRWDMGDKAGAAQLYRDILENSSVGPYAEKAKRRIAQFDGNHPASSKGATPAKPAPASPSPTAAPPSDLAPEIDTSDLPGFHQ